MTKLRISRWAVGLLFAAFTLALFFNLRFTLLDLAGFPTSGMRENPMLVLERNLEDAQRRTDTIFTVHGRGVDGLTERGHWLLNYNKQMDDAHRGYVSEIEANKNLVLAYISGSLGLISLVLMVLIEIREIGYTNSRPSRENTPIMMVIGMNTRLEKITPRVRPPVIPECLKQLKSP
jgi:hypothetical protein